MKDRDTDDCGLPSAMFTTRTHRDFLFFLLVYVHDIAVASGLSLRTEEFHDAIKEIRFHAFIQTYNFVLISAVVFGVTRLLITTGILVQSLGDGMVICSCLPMAINVVIILSITSDGDNDVAVFNSAFGNMLGVFLSPLMILGYLGVSGDVNLGEIFYKLVIRVVIPFVVGQLLQKLSKTVANFAKKYKGPLSKSQMYALIFIVYTVFCETFSTGSTVSVAEFFLVLFLQLALLISFLIIAWYALKFIFPKQPRLRVTGVYGCTFKTISLGVPLINAMYEGSPNLAMYILPLLMWYPMQLAIGSIMAPRLYKFVQQQMEELACAGVVVDEDYAPTDDGVDGTASIDSKQLANMKLSLETDKESATCDVDVESPGVVVDAQSNN